MTKIKSPAKILRSVTVYLHGDGLEPNLITSLLKVAPSNAWKKGDTHVTSAGKSIIRKAGMWSLSFKESSNQIAETIENILDIVGHAEIALKDLPNVDYTELAIFTGIIPDQSLCASDHIVIKKENLERISTHGLKLSIEISVTDD